MGVGQLQIANTLDNPSTSAWLELQIFVRLKLLILTGKELTFKLRHTYSNMHGPSPLYVHFCDESSGLPHLHCSSATVCNIVNANERVKTGTYIPVH